jgi:hypothetical protein
MTPFPLPPPGPRADGYIQEEYTCNMRRVLRIVLAIPAACSILVFVALAGSCCYGWRIKTASLDLWADRASTGFESCGYVEMPVSRDRPRDGSFAGVKWAVEFVGSASAPGRLCRIEANTLSPLTLSLAMSLGWIGARAVIPSRRHKLMSHWECPSCGYDARATPQRCPECGTALPFRSERTEVVDADVIPKGRPK